MTMKQCRLWLSVLCLVLAGCVAVSPSPVGDDPTPFHVAVLSDDIRASVAWWRTEIRERYPTQEIVMVVCHGADFGDEWWAVPSATMHLLVSDLVGRVREAHPTARIVLITCNPGGHKLDAAGVTYALDDVWVRPDVYVDPVNNVLRDMWDDSIGDIWEFQENPW
jgi:hypothetical protein